MTVTNSLLRWGVHRYRVVEVRAASRNGNRRATCPCPGCTPFGRSAGSSNNTWRCKETIRHAGCVVAFADGDDRCCGPGRPGFPRCLGRRVADKYRASTNRCDHSQTLPAISNRPYGLGGKDFTGAVRSKFSLGGSIIETERCPARCWPGGGYHWQARLPTQSAGHPPRRVRRIPIRLPLAIVCRPSGHRPWRRPTTPGPRDDRLYLRSNWLRPFGDAAPNRLPASTATTGECRRAEQRGQLAVNTSEPATSNSLFGAGVPGGT